MAMRIQGSGGVSPSRGSLAMVRETMARGSPLAILAGLSPLAMRLVARRSAKTVHLLLICMRRPACQTAGRFFAFPQPALRQNL